MHVPSTACNVCTQREAMHTYTSMGLPPWEILVAFPRESQLRQSRYRTYGASWVFYRFHNPPNSDMYHKISNVRTDVNACSCTRGCTDTVRESALKTDSGKKIPSCTGDSNLRQQRAGPMLYQLSYIPNRAAGSPCRHVSHIETETKLSWAHDLWAPSRGWQNETLGSLQLKAVATCL